MRHTKIRTTRTVSKDSRLSNPFTIVVSCAASAELLVVYALYPMKKEFQRVLLVRILSVDGGSDSQISKALCYRIKSASNKYTLLMISNKDETAVQCFHDFLMVS